MSLKTVPAPQVARRDFIKIGSLAIFGLAGAGVPSFAGLRNLPTSLLSAGYAETEPQEGAIQWLTPADRMLSGDARFISHDARVRIRSSARAASRNEKAGGAAIDVVFPALGYQPESYPTYRPWVFRRDQYGDQASAPVSFRVPVAATTGIQLLFTWLKPTSGSESGDRPPVPAPDAMLRLGLDSVPGAPKLQRGLYVIAYGEPGTRPVSNWAAVAITRHGNEIVVPDPKFSYVVLSIDYAD